MTTHGSRSLRMLIPTLFILHAAAVQSAPTGDHVVISWNDLGMHCMNRNHAVLSILPPYNTLYAQVVRRGDAATPPQLLTAGVELEYSVPGNTYSVGKTDFWDYDLALFGVEPAAGRGPDRERVERDLRGTRRSLHRRGHPRHTLHRRRTDGRGPLPARPGDRTRRGRSRTGPQPSCAARLHGDHLRDVGLPLE